jgi:uncharacterized membrane protein
MRRDTIGIGALMGLVAGVAVSMANGKALAASLLGGLAFSIVVALVVAILSWAAGASEQKGYDAWLGIVLVLIFNVVGIVILLLLPARNRGNA